MVVTHPVLFDTRSLDVVGNGPDFSKQFVQADAERTVKAGLRSPEFLAACGQNRKRESSNFKSPSQGVSQHALQGDTSVVRCDVVASHRGVDTVSERIRCNFYLCFSTKVLHAGDS